MLLDNLKDFIELAHKKDAGQAEYLLYKRISHIVRLSQNIHKEIEDFKTRHDPYSERDDLWQSKLKNSYEELSKELDMLQSIQSFIRNSNSDTEIIKSLREEVDELRLENNKLREELVTAKVFAGQYDTNT